MQIRLLNSVLEIQSFNNLRRVEIHIISIRICDFFHRVYRQVRYLSCSSVGRLKVSHVEPYNSVSLLEFQVEPLQETNKP